MGRRRKKNKVKTTVETIPISRYSDYEYSSKLFKQSVKEALDAQYASISSIYFEDCGIGSLGKLQGIQPYYPECLTHIIKEEPKEEIKEEILTPLNKLWG